jgi:hypothetical protein
MDVRRAIAVALLRADHVADRSVYRNPVTGGAEAAEVVAAFGIRIGASQAQGSRKRKQTGKTGRSRKRPDQTEVVM